MSMNCLLNSSSSGQIKIETKSSKSLSGSSLMAVSLCCPSTTRPGGPFERSIFISTTLFLPCVIEMESVNAKLLDWVGLNHLV